MTQTELKPCPFCGGKPYQASVDMAGCSYVVCTECRVQTDDDTQDRAINAWNTRTITPAEAAQVPEVKALIEAVRWMDGSVFNDNGDVTTDTGSLLTGLGKARTALRALTEGARP